MNPRKLSTRMHEALDSAGVKEGALPERVEAAGSWITYLKQQLEEATFEIRELRAENRRLERKTNDER